jgi:predicted  nucleic acid-binding Zn ribbon protein
MIKHDQGRIPTKWTPEQIRDKRSDLEQRERIIQEEYKAQQILIDKKYRILYARCPHKNMKSTQYTRWCEDCGKDWDTT